MKIIIIIIILYEYFFQIIYIQNDYLKKKNKRKIYCKYFNFTLKK